MYTSIGPVLIAVNPYKQLSKGGKGIYASGVRDYYHRKVFIVLLLYVCTACLYVLYTYVGALLLLLLSSSVE